MMISSGKENLDKEPKTIRGFFAIQVPQSIQTIVTNIQKNVLLQKQGLRWTNLNNLHLTLKFIPSISSLHIPDIIERVSENLKNSEAFFLQLNTLELFPNPNTPKALAFNIKPSKACINLVKELNESLLSLNYPIETRLFQAHVTLARLTPGLIKEEDLKKILLPKIPQIRVSKFILFASQQSELGSHYRPLAFINLVDKK